MVQRLERETQKHFKFLREKQRQICERKNKVVVSYDFIWNCGSFL
jgi:hypothetical protein